MFALFREGGATARPERLAVCAFVTWRRIDSTDDLDARDIKAIVDALDYWRECGQIEYRCRRVRDALAT